MQRMKDFRHGIRAVEIGERQLPFWKLRVAGFGSQTELVEAFNKRET